jgi:hypothetical protein
MCGRLLQALLYYCRLYFTTAGFILLLQALLLLLQAIYMVGVLCACLEHEEGGSGTDIHRYVHTDIHIGIYADIYHT